MIDFEEDVPVDDVQRLQQQVQGVAKGVQQALATASKGRLLTAGLQVSHIDLSSWSLLVSQVRMHKTAACTLRSECLICKLAYSPAEHLAAMLEAPATSGSSS